MAISALITIPIMECSLAVASSWMFLVNRDTSMSMIVYGFAKRYDVRTISKNSLEAEADEPEAAADVSGLSDFLRHVSPPLVGIALATIGLTGLAICDEDSLSEELISICLRPVASRFLFSLRVSDLTSFRIPCLKRSAMVCRIWSTRSSSRVLSGPRERSFGVGPSRGGLAEISARAVLKLLRKFWMIFWSVSFSVTKRM